MKKRPQICSIYSDNIVTLTKMINNLKIIDIIKSDTAVSTVDGNTVYEEVNEFLKREETVSLDFSDIKYLTTAFLNAALGQLYSNTYTSEFLNKHLKIKNVGNKASMFEMVIQRAKEYFENKPKFGDSADSIIYGD